MPTHPKLSYPKISDTELQNEVEKRFRKYKFTSDFIKKPLKELCTPPTQFKPQLPQRFVADIMHPKAPYTGLLVYHQIGSGKTCTAIQVSKTYVGKRHVFVVLPAFLENNIRDELRGPCGGYASAAQQKILDNPEKTQRVKEAKEKVYRDTNIAIDNDYTILSYHKFVAKLEARKIRLHNSLLIIDEVQNIVSETGKFYKVIRKAIDEADNIRVLLLSATPIFDQPHELAKTINLIPMKRKLPEGADFDRIFLKLRKSTSIMDKYTLTNKKKLQEFLHGYVSYYKGMPFKTFPHATVHTVKCSMEAFQYKCYNAVVLREKKSMAKHRDLFKMPNNFFIGSRMISNIAYPNRKASKSGFDDFVSNHSLKRANLKRYSIKFYKMMGKMNTCSGNIFIYSNFVEYGGLYPLRECLLANGWYDYLETVKAKGKGKIYSRRKYFAMWTSEESNAMKQMIREAYNSEDHPLRLVLGSPSLREGVSLLRVRQVHILEPYWNKSRLDQVMGRAIRFCSHKTLPRSEHTVDVYIYIATRPREAQLYREAKTGESENPLDMYSVDRYISELANLKESIVNEFTDLMKSRAIDCKLNQVINNEGLDKDNHIVCDIDTES